MSMPTIDLSNCNLGELKGLEYDIEKELKERQLHEVCQAREQILAIAQKVGLTPEYLIGNTVKTSKAGKAGKAGKVQARYKNPSDGLQTWSGRGRRPRWMAEGLADGKKLDDFLI